MTKGNITVQTENIFPIIKKFLYSDHEIFLRELISNAIDATSKLEAVAGAGEIEGDLGDLTIHVTVDKAAGTITISDRGIGMTESEVKKYLNQLAFSSAEDFVKKYQGKNNIIGHFGLGFYSAFMVADQVEVITRSYKKTPKGVHWICDGNPEYEIEEIDRKERGTDIILHISDDSKEFLEHSRIENLLKKYCSFLPFPIQMGMKKDVRWEGEGEDRKKIETEVPNIINDTNPLWKKKPGKLSDQDYLDFYRKLYPMSPDPMFWIHLNIDYPFNLTGILYFPKISNQFDQQKNKIHLYSNQVYVTDEVKEIVPEFLTLLHGVIDSPDIPLNVSRSYLQSDSNVKKITGYLTKKVAERLGKLFKDDRAGYEQKWDDIGVFVKYGMITDEKFAEKAIDFVLLKNTDGKYFTFEEYKEKIKANQTDKNDRIVALYTPSPEIHTSYIRNATEMGYDVLLLNHVIDNHFIQHMEYKGDKLSFARVDADTPGHLIQKDEKTESVLSEKEQEKVKELFTPLMGGQDHQLIIRPMAPDGHPVLITRPEFMRRMQEMQMMQGANGMDMMDQYYQVIVNSNHPLIAEKLINMRSQEKKEKFAAYLLRLAKLNQGMLKGEEMSSFINDSIEFLS
ncbi:MAG: molecular chaperone HtpG [Saprospiraceae bacterium]|uniref:Chaperone protein HtpG n=1 Tax=Candidatus Opimibacter skivensis TaxID=2982028 RepID=A0A9D7XUL8_9BACT|nr:molecular chaperone HtpG [Candidatus Opimibacter skivensis]